MGGGGVTETDQQQPQEFFMHLYFKPLFFLHCAFIQAFKKLLERFPYKYDQGIYIFFSTKNNFIHLPFFLVYAVSKGKVYQKEKVSYTTF